MFAYSYFFKFVALYITSIENVK